MRRAGHRRLVGLLMALCRQRFSATQFALLSALSAVGRTYLAGPLTPPLVELFGWPGFFLITVLIAVPGLLLLYLLRDRIEDMVRGGDSLIGLSPARDYSPAARRTISIAGQRLQQPFGHAADGGAQDAGAAVRAGDHQVGPVVERILRQHRFRLAAFEHHLGPGALGQFGRFGQEFRILFRRLVEIARHGFVRHVLALEGHVVGMKQRQVRLGHQVQRGAQLPRAGRSRWPRARRGRAGAGGS